MFSKLILFSRLLLFVTSSVGPIGYQLFRNSEDISGLRSAVQTKQFSSFDRKGGNADGGPFECLRRTQEGHCIIAECIGSGEIDSIWMTRDNGVFNKTGHIVIVLDGVTVVDNRLQDILDGKIGAPFLWPLVANGDDTSGGGVIKIPMPFNSSMKVIVDSDPVYYHVTYRQFFGTKGIKTFDPKDKAEDVIKLLRGFGLNDPKPVSKKSFQAVLKNISSDTSKTIFEQANSAGVINEIRITIPQLVRSPRNVDDGRAFGLHGWSQFIAAIDARNTGVRISRRLDPNVKNQIAVIKVDGSSAGVWNSTTITDKGWAEETVLIDAKLTTNKTSITIRQEFHSSSYDFNEFRYEIDSLVSGQWFRSDVIDVGPDHPGAEKAHDYQINGQTFAGQRVFRYTEDAKKLQTSDQFLTETRIRATFDGIVTVDAPLGQFFGTGLGMYDTRSLWFSVDARNSMFRTFWPMPFAKDAKLELIFGNKSDIDYDIRSEVMFDLNTNIKTLFDNQLIGYFHAFHRQETTQPGLDYVFLNTTGRGVVYGVTATMRGLIKSGNTRDYLEGDERIYIDGKRTPDLYGTGTEDFFESGWYFRGGITFDMPLNGNSGYETTGDDCLYDCTQAYRLYSGGISFDSSIVFGIEHGPVDDNEPAIYSSVTFWYGRSEPMLKQTDTVNISDEKSRERHEYRVEKEVKYQLNSSFEGQNYHKIESHFVLNTSMIIEFKVSIDVNNKGVKILRTSDQYIAYQCVDVNVDNALIGTWLQPLGNQWSRLLDDSYDLPSDVTHGKNVVHLKLIPRTYENGPKVWTAINYKIFSVIQD